MPGTVLDDPTELVRTGALLFRVARREVLLRDRIVGFVHWRQPAYGQQAIDMLAAFDPVGLDTEWLIAALRREGALAAYDALRELAANDAPVTEVMLDRLLDVLHARRGGAPD